MAILKNQVVTVETIDTDTFTREQWISFIKQTLSATTIVRVLRDSSMSKDEQLAVLKHLAIKAAFLHRHDIASRKAFILEIMNLGYAALSNKQGK